MAKDAVARDDALSIPAVAVPEPVGIPVSSIHSLRESFPGKSLVFEIDLAVSDCWNGLEHLASAFRAAGARLRLLRCTQSGLISCTVSDGGADLGLLAAQLSPVDGVSVAAWTTRIDYD